MVDVCRPLLMMLGHSMYLPEQFGCLYWLIWLDTVHIPELDCCWSFQCAVFQRVGIASILSTNLRVRTMMKLRTSIYEYDVKL